MIPHATVNWYHLSAECNGESSDCISPAKGPASVGPRPQHPVPVKDQQSALSTRPHQVWGLLLFSQSSASVKDPAPFARLGEASQRVGLLHEHYDGTFSSWDLRDPSECKVHIVPLEGRSGKEIISQNDFTELKPPTWVSQARHTSFLCSPNPTPAVSSLHGGGTVSSSEHPKG